MTKVLVWLKEFFGTDEGESDFVQDYPLASQQSASLPRRTVVIRDRQSGSIVKVTVEDDEPDDPPFEDDEDR